ncbi:MAG: DUF2071 domain-containing protein [Phycisphaerales bacterium]|nr:DUF2071 domain-containing protein [Phycisphaerales bacterium]MCB9856296.1 DUF2071 domain-containing protein [Phycisphaerales bacterium]MCB9863265.1 DUF2071 domain-containing protein [Phycisphaerales bacterium]
MQAERNAHRQSRLSAEARARFMDREGQPPLLSDWLATVMIHYEVDAAVLQRDVPFELDLFEGRAFVTLVAFTMADLRTRRWPRLSRRLFQPIGTHAFLNVRTYVRVGDEPGIYFLAEFLPNRLSVLLGPVAYGLPYRYGRLDYQHDNDASVMTGAVHLRGAPRANARISSNGANGCLPKAVRQFERGFQTCSAVENASVSKAKTAPKERQFLATGGAETAKRSERNPWLAFFLGLSPERATQFPDSLCLPPSVHARIESDEPRPTHGDVDTVQQTADSTQDCEQQSAHALRYRVRRQSGAMLEPAAENSLTEFLMERYTAYTKWAGLVRRFRIWHEPWPQEPVEPEILDDSLLRVTGEWSRSAMLHSANYSPSLTDVWMGRPRRMRSVERSNFAKERGITS